VGEFRQVHVRDFAHVCLGQAKVEDLDLAVWRDFNVGRFQVTMDDSFLMCGLKRFRDLLREPEGFVYRNCPTLQPVGQRIALDEFKNEKTRGSGLLQPVDGGNIGMIQRCEHTRFAFESRQSFHIPFEFGRQNLYRHFTAELAVVRPINFTHATLAGEGP
jgi:hypothetical protein